MLEKKKLFYTAWLICRGLLASNLHALSRRAAPYPGYLITVPGQKPNKNEAKTAFPRPCLDPGLAQVTCLMRYAVHIFHATLPQIPTYFLRPNNNISTYFLIFPHISITITSGLFVLCFLEHFDGVPNQTYPTYLINLPA